MKSYFKKKKKPKYKDCFEYEAFHDYMDAHTHTHTVNASFDQSIPEYNDRMLAQWSEDTTIALQLWTLSHNSLQSLCFILKTLLSFSEAASHLEKLLLYSCTSSISLQIKKKKKKLCLHFKNSTSISAA